MKFADPILKHYYELFTYGKNSEKLEEVKNFIRTKLYLANDMAGDLAKFGQVDITAHITRMIVDEHGQGYALLNVLVFFNKKYDEPVDMLNDLAIIDKGVLHTWFPYQKVSFYAEDNHVHDMPIVDYDDYITKKAIDFIMPICRDNDLYMAVQDSTPNGAYTSVEFQNTCNHNQKGMRDKDLLDVEKWERKATNDEPKNLAEALESLGYVEDDEDDFEPMVEENTHNIAEEDIIDGEFTESAK